MLRGKKIIITGAKGFIGSTLATHLAKDNEVFGIDNLIHGPNPVEVCGVKYFDCNASEVSSHFVGKSIDYFFHFGEYSRVEKSFHEPLLTFQNTIAQLPAVLQFCAINNTKLIYSASSTRFAQYFDEKVSPYAQFKALNAQIISDFAKHFELDYAIAYFYNVYGPSESNDEKYGTVIAKYKSLCENCAEYLPVTRPGTQIRNFTHVDDTIDALIRIALFGAGDGYGIGTDEAFSILDVVSMFGKKPQFFPEKMGNRKNAEIKTDKTKALGWVPKRSLKSYISECVK